MNWETQLEAKEVLAQLENSLTFVSGRGERDLG